MTSMNMCSQKHMVCLLLYEIIMKYYTQKAKKRELDKSAHTTTLGTPTHPLYMPQILQWAYLIQLPEKVVTNKSLPGILEKYFFKFVSNKSTKKKQLSHFIKNLKKKTNMSANTPTI